MFSKCPNFSTNNCNMFKLLTVQFYPYNIDQYNATLIMSKLVS